MCLPHPAEPRVDKRGLFRVGRGAREENIVVICCYMFLHGPEAFAIQLRVLNLPVDHRLPALCARGCVCARERERVRVPRAHTLVRVYLRTRQRSAHGKHSVDRHCVGMPHPTLMCWLIL